MGIVLLLILIFGPLLIYLMMRDRSRYARWLEYERQRLHWFAEELDGRLRGGRAGDLSGSRVTGTLEGRRVHLHVAGLRQGRHLLRLGVGVDPRLSLRLELPSLLGRLRRAIGMGGYVSTGSAADAQVVVSSHDGQTARDVFVEGGRELQKVLNELLTYTEEIVAADGWLYLDCDLPELEHRYLRWLLERMVKLARFYERRPIRVRALGNSEAMAWTGGTSRARCPYCHDDLREEDLALVACSGCQTVHHQACYEEHGGCTIFGCQTRVQGAPRQRA